MTDILTISQLARQYSIRHLASAELLPYHNIETLNRILESLELLSTEAGLTEDETVLARLAVCFYFTGFENIKASNIKDYYGNAFQKSSSLAREWLNHEGLPVDKKNNVLHLLENLFSEDSSDDMPVQVAMDALHSDWARERGKKHFKALLEELHEMAGQDKQATEMEGHRLLYEHGYLTDYGKSTLAAGKIQNIEKLEKDFKHAERQTDIILKKELHVEENELKQLKKKLRSIRERDDKSFMDMLRSTSRNHYTLNQMIDRKARIIVWVNAGVLSYIINRMMDAQNLNDWRIYLLILPSISGLVSVFYAVLSIRLEKKHGKLSTRDIRQSKGNPLFFGNFQSLPLEAYENSMMAMVNNKEFVFRAMIQDIYYLGQTLQLKSKYLHTSLYIFLAGMTLTLIMAFLLRISSTG